MAGLSRVVPHAGTEFIRAAGGFCRRFQPCHLCIIRGLDIGVVNRLCDDKIQFRGLGAAIGVTIVVFNTCAQSKLILPGHRAVDIQFPAAHKTVGSLSFELLR